MNMEWLRTRAEAHGFTCAFPLTPVYAPRTEIIPHNARLTDDAKALMPDVKAVLALIKPYAPYVDGAESGRGAMVSAYYPASNEAYFGALALARELSEQAYTVVPNADLPVKPLLMRYKLAQAGRNGLLSLGDMGTRFHVQLMLTNAPLCTLAPPTPVPTYSLSASCGKCSLCVRACPAGALDGTGHVDVTKCLRALSSKDIVPEDKRALFGNRLLGCDVCQEVCPRNARVQSTPMPHALDEALSLKRLLSGDIQALGGWIGKNYTRTAQIRMRAALVAGNLLRADCAPLLEDILINGTPGEHAHAQWALKQIRGGLE